MKDQCIGGKNLDSKDMVLQTLIKADNPLKSGEIAEMSGLDKKDVDKAIKILKEEGKIQSPKKCYYSMTK